MSKRVRLRKNADRQYSRPSYAEQRTRALRTRVEAADISDRDVSADGLNGSAADNHDLDDNESVVDTRRDFILRNGNPRGAGRPPGRENKLPAYLKQCILLAAADVGEDGHGKGQLQGYLRRLAIHHPSVFGSLLKRILPVTIKADASLAVEVLAAIRGDQHGSPLLPAFKIEHRPSEDAE